MSAVSHTLPTLAALPFPPPAMIADPDIPEVFRAKHATDFDDMVNIFMVDGGSKMHNVKNNPRLKIGDYMLTPEVFGTMTSLNVASQHLNAWCQMATPNRALVAWALYSWFSAIDGRGRTLKPAHP